MKAGNAEYPITIDPLSTTPGWMAEGNQEFARFGTSVSNAGDVNGDGYDDIIVGAPRYENGQSMKSRAFVYHGSESGLSTNPDWIAEGDQEGAWFGTSVSTAGDVNGDGYDDVIVGAPQYDYSEHEEDYGRVFIYHGSDQGLSDRRDWAAGPDQDAKFGSNVSTAGDVNSDGYDDVVVGAHGYDNGKGGEGTAFVFLGSKDGINSTPIWTPKAEQKHSAFGSSVSTAGDVNGDGYDDVIIGDHYYSNNQPVEGRAFVYYGSSQGLNTTPDWTAEGDQKGAYLGVSVSTAGDVNGDGYDDVIVGAFLYDNGQNEEGSTYVYHGSNAGLSDSPNWIAEGNKKDAYFGQSVSTAGDVNGDGYDDVIIGAYGYDNEEGRAFFYQGSDQGLSTTSDWTANGNQENAEFGISVSTAGDVNGDCGDDVIIGAPNYDNGQEFEGKAFVYHGDYAGQPAPESDSIVFKKWPISPTNDSFATYTIKSIERADTIKWTFPDDWTIQNRQGDTAIQVKVGSAGEICITPANDCGEADTCIQVDPVNPNISDTTVCEGDTVKIGPSLPTAQSIEWNTGDTVEQIRIDTSGTYAYEALMEDSIIYRDTAQVTIAPRPHVYVGPDKAFCGKIDYRINPDVKGGNKYQWNTGDTTKTLHVDEEGRYWLRVESEASCSNADTTQIREIAYPKDFDTNQMKVCEATVQLDASNPGANHIWNTGDTTQKITVDEDGQYIVSIANAYCSIRDTVEVKINEESACPYLFVPNAFSPNGDGLNDVFKPEGQKILDYEMTIYNRWGQRVFQSGKGSKGWSGNHDEQRAPAGRYLYQIEYRVKERGIQRIKTREGMVNLMR